MVCSGFGLKLWACLRPRIASTAAMIASTTPTMRKATPSGTISERPHAAAKRSMSTAKYAAPPALPKSFAMFVALAASTRTSSFASSTSLRKRNERSLLIVETSSGSERSGCSGSVGRSSTSDTGRPLCDDRPDRCGTGGDGRHPFGRQGRHRLCVRHARELRGAAVAVAVLRLAGVADEPAGEEAGSSGAGEEGHRTASREVRSLLGNTARPERLGPLG